MIPSKNALRSTSVGSTFFAFSRSDPSASLTSAYSVPTRRIRSSLSVRASAGDFPPVEIAICTEPLSTIAGTMNSQSGVTSTTLTGILRARQSAAICSLTRWSSVEAITIEAPSRPPASYGLRRMAILPSRAHCSISLLGRGAGGVDFGVEHESEHVWNDIQDGLAKTARLPVGRSQAQARRRHRLLRVE